MRNNLIQKFNDSSVLGIISSFPAYGGELARGNAISRYTYLLTRSFPDDQKIVVFCEKRGSGKPYKIGKNILVVPTYKLNSFNFFGSLFRKIGEFGSISNFLVQFEFSVFGGKVVIPQFLLLLSSLKLMGKSVKIMFHQVVSDINTLSGHLAIGKDSLKSCVLNFLLKSFYTISGVLSDKIFVHDRMLADRISEFVDSSKLVIIPHGVEIKTGGQKLSGKSAKRFFGVSGDTRLIGLFGYCSWYKGTDWLIENFAKFARENKNIKIKLLVAGGESPTLKGTLAYAKYHKRLKKVIKEANGNIIYTGFVLDRDVEKVFSAVDLFVFPYRTKMSASGAFSLTLGYKKPFIVSKAFSENVNKVGLKGKVFSLNYKSFANVLNRTLNGSFSGVSFGDIHSWQEVSGLYLKESLSGTSIDPKLSYA